MQILERLQYSHATRCVLKKHLELTQPSSLHRHHRRLHSKLVSKHTRRKPFPRLYVYIFAKNRCPLCHSPDLPVANHTSDTVLSQECD
jgi:hypothetical protein